MNKINKPFETGKLRTYSRNTAIIVSVLRKVIAMGLVIDGCDKKILEEETKKDIIECIK